MTAPAWLWWFFGFCAGLGVGIWLCVFIVSQRPRGQVRNPPPPLHSPPKPDNQNQARRDFDAMRRD